ncbi:hypothetical protein FOZ62_022391 [Perkinsus olseni]|uniref:Uncharacterized protein n=1 Tax=Perkinsus olseni TaxID=32597 RepID=A0A7J6PAS1_PEROL|nr:hypothetical protein FOZ62_022391 [Perkinsus olseni]
MAATAPTAALAVVEAVAVTVLKLAALAVVEATVGSLEVVVVSAAVVAPVVAMAAMAASVVKLAALAVVEATAVLLEAMVVAAVIVASVVVPAVMVAMLAFSSEITWVRIAVLPEHESCCTTTITVRINNSAMALAFVMNSVF